jgi:Raf kinase inhibitor-like YbhB/YbcL family protein
MLRAMKRILLGLVIVTVAGCGNDTNNQGPLDARPIDTPPGAFALTSTVFTAGGMIPVAYSCHDPANVNMSPPLAWTGAPSPAQSFAVVVLDPDAPTPPFRHWVIYDIPASATGLPEHVENAYAPANVAGAHQAPSQHTPTIGYYGPCPPAEHSYHFTLYALDVATLPGTSAQTSAADAIAAIATHQIASTELVGKFKP